MSVKVVLLIALSFQLNSSLEARNKSHRHKFNNCRKPQRVKAISHPEGIEVKWEFKHGSSRERLNIRLINFETKEEYPKEVDYAKAGTEVFTQLPTQQGKYRARVNVYSCTKYRESGEVKWPPIQMKSEKKCTCGQPDTVIVTPGDGVTLSWSKCTGPGDSIVGVIEDNGNDAKGEIFIVSETVSAEKIQDMTNKTFPNFNPKSGRYMGVIGTNSCGNTYRTSETFFWPVEKTQTIPEMKQAILKKKKAALSNTNIAICIVSLVATTGVVAIGIFVYTTFKKSKESRDQECGCPEMTFDHTRRKLKKKLCTVQSVTVLYPAEQDDLFNTAIRLTRQVLDQGRNAVSREITCDLDFVDVDVILYITTEGDIEVPELLKPLIDRVIVVAIMGKGQITPSVYFPGNFIYNDDVDDVTTLDDLLQSLGDDRKKLFLLCNAEKENQRRRSTVIEIFQEANFDVIDPDDLKHRDKQRENLYQWAAETLEESHYIIIVPEDDDRLNHCPSNLTRCAMTTLDLLQTLDQRELSTRVLLVTFGEKNLDQFISKRPYLSVCYHFALWEGDNCPQVMLRPLLTHLGIEQDVCFEDSDALL